MKTSELIATLQELAGNDNPDVGIKDEVGFFDIKQMFRSETIDKYSQKESLIVLEVE